MLEGDHIDLGSFLVNQLYSAATSSIHTIVIRGLITPIASLLGVEPNHDDRVADSEWLNLAAFKQIKFCRADVRRICWIYPRNCLMPLPNVNCTSLLNEANLCFLPGDEELVRPVPPPPPTHPRASSSS